MVSERTTPQGQLAPSPEWDVVRRMFPGRAAVRLLDDGVDEFWLLSPKADCSDIALDGRTLTKKEAEAELTGQDLQFFRPEWASA